MKRLRKELQDRILDEEVKEDERQTKAKVKNVRTSTNESNFKVPAGHSTPVKSGSGSKSNSLNSSMMQPQASIQQSPGISQRMQGITLGSNAPK
jgi:hypothetical protein